MMMPDLETLAEVHVPGASRELVAMQLLARDLSQADVANPRLRSLVRTLTRDLAAAQAGQSAPWSEARTRFEARKLARIVSSDAPIDVGAAPSYASNFADEFAATDEGGKRAIIVRIAIAAVALALWALWIGWLGRAGQVAWDGGTGPAQTQNLFALYAPAVLALLLTLIAITPSERVRQS
jgi:hypothetical protein